MLPWREFLVTESIPRNQDQESKGNSVPHVDRRRPIRSHANAHDLFDVTDKLAHREQVSVQTAPTGPSGKLLGIALVLVSPKAGRPTGMTSNVKGLCETPKTSNGSSQNEDSVSFWRIRCGAAGRVKGSTDGTYCAASYRMARACVWFRSPICCSNGFSFSLIGNGE